MTLSTRSMKILAPAAMGCCLAAGLGGCKRANETRKEPVPGVEPPTLDSAHPSRSGVATPDSKPARPSTQQMAKMVKQRGWLDAHKNLQKPHELLGGPITVKVDQTSGVVHVALPDNRRLDPDVFGTPGMPRAFGGYPVVVGVPLKMRNSTDGHYTQLEVKTPFGHANRVLPDGKLSLKAVDATATDAATTEDSVQMKASWKDKQGNTYEVDCCTKVAAHGVQYPSFGGVVTNHMMHGWTGIGTPLMPTEFAYVAFWGMGQVEKNGKTLAKPRLVHGMLTEYVRTKDYRLGFDKDINPTLLQFHLIVPPVMPDKNMTSFDKSPVHTGYMAFPKKELPFWHVMFGNVKVKGTRGK